MAAPSPEDGLTIWNVLTIIILPLIGGGFLLLWNHMAKSEAQLWVVINGLRKDLSDFKLQAFTTFAQQDGMKELRDELLKHLDRIEKKIDAVKPCV